uniref:Protein detoxification 16 n=1 Tax=Vitis vinifera TaxID=29760 RepID=A5BJ09_VITVI|nr:hypothetical protein VITISV_035001 [Vitis vinifera]
MDSEEEILSPCVSDSDVDDKDLWRVEIGEEVKKQLALAGPLTIVGVLRYLTQAVSLMFVGHLGELPLASASMAASFASVTGFSLLRAMSVLLLVSVPLAFIWAKTEHILMNLGQDPYISRGAGRFLQTQKIVFPVMLISAITTLFHFPTCWILVFKTSLGSAGAALACSISSWINVFLLVLYVKFSPACKQTWTGVSEMNIQDVLSFLRLAVPSASMVCLTTCAMLFNIYLGIGSAGSIRISNELGAGRPQKAYLAVHAVLILANVFGMLLGSIMFLLRRTWGYLFSNKEEVVKYVASMMPLLATSALLDAIQCALSGIVRGCGWQKIGAIVNLGAYYLVGIPCALLFTFDFGLGGKAKKAEAEVCRSRYMDYVPR